MTQDGSKGFQRMKTSANSSRKASQYIDNPPSFYFEDQQKFSERFN
jgi:hypothetical protein